MVLSERYFPDPHPGFFKGDLPNALKDHIEFFIYSGCADFNNLELHLRTNPDWSEVDILQARRYAAYQCEVQFNMFERKRRGARVRHGVA